MELIALPALADNYIWMLRQGSQALVVDPGDAAAVCRALDERSLELAGILVTHHHADHVAGLPGLRPRLKGPVWGPAGEAIAGVDHPVHEGDRIAVLGCDWQVLDVPGHTAGHIAYFCDALPLSAASAATPFDDDAAGNATAPAPLLFCGDTLFSAGCGRVFDGTVEALQASVQRLGGLPPATLVCCTHEYTLANLRFAQAVEPDNPEIARHAVRCEALRAAGRPTLPSRMVLEHRINPFLRCDQPAVALAARPHGAADADPCAVFAALRRWKNTYR